MENTMKKESSDQQIDNLYIISLGGYTWACCGGLFTLASVLNNDIYGTLGGLAFTAVTFGIGSHYNKKVQALSRAAAYTTNKRTETTAQEK